MPSLKVSSFTYRKIVVRRWTPSTTWRSPRGLLIEVERRQRDSQQEGLDETPTLPCLPHILTLKVRGRGRCPLQRSFPPVDVASSASYGSESPPDPKAFGSSSGGKASTSISTPVGWLSKYSSRVSSGLSAVCMNWLRWIPGCRFGRQPDGDACALPQDATSPKWRFTKTQLTTAGTSGYHNNNNPEAALAAQGPRRWPVSLASQQSRGTLARASATAFTGPKRHH